MLCLVQLQINQLNLRNKQIEVEGCRKVTDHFKRSIYNILQINKGKTERSKHHVSSSTWKLLRLEGFYRLCQKMVLNGLHGLSEGITNAVTTDSYGNY